MGELTAGPAFEESRNLYCRWCFQKGFRQDAFALQRLLQTALHRTTGDAFLTRLDETFLILGTDNSRVPKTGQGIRLSNLIV
jgi:hypothetical protein